jgi:hypothetical protein
MSTPFECGANPYFHPPNRERGRPGAGWSLSC